MSQLRMNCSPEEASRKRPYCEIEFSRGYTPGCVKTSAFLMAFSFPERLKRFYASRRISISEKNGQTNPSGSELIALNTLFDLTPEFMQN
jgi:hypothetical protein